MGDKPLSSDDVHQASNSSLEQADYEAQKQYGRDNDSSARGLRLRAAPKVGNVRPARGQAAGNAVEIDRNPTSTPWGKGPKSAAITTTHNADVRKQKMFADATRALFKAPVEVPDHDRPHLDRAPEEMTQAAPKLDTFVPTVQLNKPKLSLKPKRRSLEQIEVELKSGKPLRDIGALFNEAHDQLKHGQWLPWFERICGELGVSPRTAQYYRQAARGD